MAATRIISGKLREIWQEIAHQPGGAPQVVTTGIRISAQQLSRVRGVLVIDSVVGAAAPSASAQVSAAGFLQVVVANGVGGTSINWTLDVELTHSVQQAMDAPASAYIAVVSGYGIGGVASAQNLAQTYAFGAVTANQTMIVDTAKGGGVIVDASTAVVTAPDVALEIRQNATHSTPANIARWGNDGGSALVQLTKARGTPAVPAAVQVADVLGTLAFRGYTAAAAYTELARIEVKCGGPGPAHLTNMAFYITDHAGVFREIITMQNDGIALPGSYVQFWDSPSLFPDTNDTGSLGISSQEWLSAYIATVHATSNVILGAPAAVGGGANHTVLLPNTSTMPVPQANQVYIGSVDFGVGAGSNLAVLALSAEEPAVAITLQTPDNLIPIVYNGTPYYLFATEIAPG